MSNQLINVFFVVNLLITGIKADLFEDYVPEDFNGDSNLNLLQLLKNYVERSRALRESRDSQDWPGRWFPDRLSDPTPPPKIFHNTGLEPHNSGSHSSDANVWPGRWMPEGPSDPIPPPKIFHSYALEHQNSGAGSSDKNAWLGRWMPESPSDPTPSPKVFHEFKLNEPVFRTDPSGRIAMGVKSVYCDDGKTNLTVDWDHSPVDYTCYGHRITPEKRIKPEVYRESIPPYYVAIHKCMKDVIHYDDDIPLYGAHRPIWPIYGEYKFVPPQRWVHSLEHGAVVMLYHPCANSLEVKRLRELVTSCIRRHIITPSNMLDVERPLALVTWGCRLSMSYVNRQVVENFIMENALKGPERVEDDGDFEDGLLNRAKIVSDIMDSKLCSNLNAQNSQNNGKSM